MADVIIQIVPPAASTDSIWLSFKFKRKEKYDEPYIFIIQGIRMKRLLKKITIIVSVLVFFATIPVTASFINEAYESLVRERGREYVTNYINSLEILNTLLDSFPTTRDGRILYPDDFAGVYFDYDGMLVVLLVGDDEATVASFELNHIDDGFIVRKAEHSYNELWEVMNFLNEFIPQNKELSGVSNVHAWQLDIIENRIIVYLADIDAIKIELFKYIISDSSIIDFKLSPGQPSFNTPAYSNNFLDREPPFPYPTFPYNHAAPMSIDDFFAS